MRFRSSSAAAVLAAATLPVPFHLAGHKHHLLRRPGQAPRPAAKSPGTNETPSVQPPAARVHKRHSRRHRRRHHHHLLIPLGAHAAGDPNDAISDFKYTPGTLTIQAGDTVTWTNDGPSQHSATANHGSFNTGLLTKGASASHTFTTPGTYTYFCVVHPFMHGTIVVLASNTTTTTPTTSTPTTTTSPSSATPTGSGATTPATTTSSGPSLPMTGLDLGITLLSGVTLAAAGFALRRPSSGLPQRESGDDRTPPR